MGDTLHKMQVIIEATTEPLKKGMENSRREVKKSVEEIQKETEKVKNPFKGILCTYYKAAITWYYIVASVIAAFIVYLVATGGWEKVKEIWERTKYKNSEGE